MPDQKPSHLPADGEGTPALPGESDLARPSGPAGAPAPGDDDFVPATTHPA